MRKSFQQLEYELLELQKELAIRGIECYAGDERNFYYLGKALEKIGDFLFRKESFDESNKAYSKAIQAYQRSLEVLKSNLPKQNKTRKNLYILRVQSQIVGVLKKRAHVNLCLGLAEKSEKDLEKAKILAEEIEDSDAADEISSKLRILHEYLRCDVEHNVSRILQKELAEYLNGLKNGCFQENHLVKYSPFVKLLEPNSILKKVFPRISHLVASTTKAMSSTDSSLKENLSREWYKLGMYIIQNAAKYISKNPLDPIPNALIYKNLHKIAKECFRIAAEIYPNNFGAWHKLGWQCVFYTKEYEPAKDALTRSIQIENQVKELFLFNLNPSLENDLKSGNISENLRTEFKKNTASLSKSATIKPLSSNEWEIQSRSGKYIIRKFGEILAVYKESKYSHFSKIGIGKLYVAQGNVPLAEKWLKEGLNDCITFYLESIPQRVIDVLVETAESLRKLGELDNANRGHFLKEALELYRKAREISATKINPSGGQTRVLEKTIKLLDIHYVLVGERKLKVNPNMALDEILSSKLIDLLNIETLPYRLKTLYQKEYAFTILGLYEKAVEYADKILMLKPNDLYTIINKAQSLGNLKRYSEALECVEEALGIDENNVYAIHNKGFYLLKLGRYEEAIKEFERLTITEKLKPDYPPAWYNMGYAIHKLNIKLKKKEKEEKAIMCYDEALKLLNQNPELHKEEIVTTLDNKGYSLIILGEYGKREGNIGKAKEIWEKAIKECFDEALKLNPRFIKALNNKGQALGKLKRFSEAHECLKKAYGLALEEKLNEKEPEYFASILDNEGYIFSEEAKEKEGEEAIELLKKALSSFDEAIKACSTYASAWQNKIYTLFKLNVREAVPKGQLILSLSNTIKEAFQNVKEKKEFLINTRRSIIHCLADAVSSKEKFISSREELIFLIESFNEILLKFDETIEKISLQEINNFM